MPCNSFQSEKNVYMHDYYLEGALLSRIDSVRDLVVTFSADLTFEKQIQAITDNAFRKLGFIMRSSKYFRNICTLRLLFCSLVRHLEYASIVWALYQNKYNVNMERIQHRFFCRVSFRTDKPMYYYDHCYDHILNKFNVITLKNRRKLFD